jgi:hypothetical protein
MSNITKKINPDINFGTEGLYGPPSPPTIEIWAWDNSPEMFVRCEDKSPIKIRGNQKKDSKEYINTTTTRVQRTRFTTTGACNLIRHNENRSTDN